MTPDELAYHTNAAAWAAITAAHTNDHTQLQAIVTDPTVPTAGLAGSLAYTATIFLRTLAEAADMNPTDVLQSFAAQASRYRDQTSP